MRFNITNKDKNSAARTGILSLPNGDVTTPVFMPVGTNATVKALTVNDLKEIGFQIILANTYHLFLRPGMEVFEKVGGLHKFMNWDRNILTDSGGFQIYSLSSLRKIKDEGAWFQSHVDGSKHFLSPEIAVEVQAVFGSDIQMQLDYCSSWGVTRKEAENALKITVNWLERAKKTWQKITKEKNYKGELFTFRVNFNFRRADITNCTFYFHGKYASCAFLLVS